MTNFLTREHKTKILERDNFICQMCGKTVSNEIHILDDAYGTVDHIVQVSRKGTSKKENLATCCRKCNLKRGGRKSQDKIKFGCSADLDFIKNLIKYEKRYGILDEKLLAEKLIKYRNELLREMKAFNQIIHIMEEQHGEQTEFLCDNSSQC